MQTESSITCFGSDLCQELAGDPDVSFTRVYEGDPPSRVILDTENLSLIADISPLALGHLLLVSKRHYYSFAEVIADHGREVAELQQAFHGQYEQTFGAPLVFEHGSTEDMESAACVTHAHWHYLPLDAEMVDRILIRDGLKPTSLSGISDLARMRALNTSYYYRAAGHTHFLYGVGESKRRQYFRSVAGEILGIPDPEWDWAVVVRKDILRETVAAAANWKFSKARPPRTSRR